MAINRKGIRIFKIKNRSGYAAVFRDHLTEGRTPDQVYDRMVKAVRRTTRKNKRK